MRRSIVPIVIIVAIVSALIIFSVNDKSPRFTFDPKPVITMVEGSFLQGCESDDICYMPHDITIATGTKVTWVNVDSDIHTIASGDADNPTGLYDSGIVQPGGTFVHTFEDPGNYKYYCTIHPWATGFITVI